jgi:hypothetical protein
LVFDVLCRVALARATRGSNTIEGFTVTVDDAFAALDDEEPMDADALAWRAVRGYRDAMTYVLELAKDQSTPLSVDTLRALHVLMQQYDLTQWPGRWRPSEVFVRVVAADRREAGEAIRAERGHGPHRPRRAHGRQPRVSDRRRPVRTGRRGPVTVVDLGGVL